LILRAHSTLEVFVALARFPDFDFQWIVEFSR